MMIAALFALAFSLAMGQAGMLSFGHSAYYGLGAFAALHLMQAVEETLLALPTPARSRSSAPPRVSSFGTRVRLVRHAAHGRLLRDGDAGAGRAPVHAGAHLEFAVRRRVRHLDHARCLPGRYHSATTPTSTT